MATMMLGKRELECADEDRRYPLPWVSFDPDPDGLYCWICEVGKACKGARDRRSRFLAHHRRCGFRAFDEQGFDAELTNNKQQHGGVLL